MSLFIFFILLYSSSTFAQTNNNVINANEAVNKSQKVIVGEFSQQSLTGWEEKEFAGKTRYKLIKIAGQYVLSARSQQAASGLFKTIHIDLNKTPYLNWSWSIQSSLNNINEQSKSGDDYAARIYIVKKHFFFWKTKALNYVWSSNQAKLSHWDNAFTSQAKMLAIRGKQSLLNHWYTEKRNVKEDFKHFFGEEIDSIDVVALMSDTDNSKLSEQALYGDIYFTAE